MLDRKNRELLNENEELRRQLLGRSDVRNSSHSDLMTEESRVEINEINELAAEVKRLLERVAKMESKNKDLKRLLKEREDTLSDKENKSERTFRENLDSALNKIKTLEGANKELQRKLKEKERELEKAIKRESNYLKNVDTIRKLKEELEEVQDRLENNKTKNMTYIENGIYELEGRYRLLEDEKRQLERENGELRRNLSESNERFEVDLRMLSEVE